MKAVNLIPGEQRAGAGSLTGRSGGGALIVLAVIAGLAAMAAMYGSAHRQISSQAGETASIAAQTQAVQARAGKLTPYTSFVSMAEQRVQTVSQLVQARFDWSHVLHELGRVLPAGTSLNSLHGTVGSAAGASGASAAPSTASASAGATPTSSTPPGSTPVFTLAGCASNQSVVAQMLQRLRLMDGATEVQLQSSTKSGSSSSSGGSGGCPGEDPAFTVVVTFTGLPSAPPPSAAAKAPSSTVASQSGGTTEPVAAQSGGAPR